MNINSINSTNFKGYVQPKLVNYIKKQTEGAIREEELKAELGGRANQEKIDKYTECQANILKMLTEKAGKMGMGTYIGLQGGDSKDPVLKMVVGYDGGKHADNPVETTPIRKTIENSPYNPYTTEAKTYDNPNDWTLEVKGVENMSAGFVQPKYILQSLVSMTRGLQPETSEIKLVDMSEIISYKNNYNKNIK